MSLQWYEVKTEGEALAYLLDCGLATVEHLAGLKSRSVGEVNRQIMIAQKNYEWVKKFAPDYIGSRAKEVEGFDGSVHQWFVSMDVKRGNG